MVERFMTWQGERQGECALPRTGARPPGHARGHGTHATAHPVLHKRRLTLHSRAPRSDSLLPGPVVPTSPLASLLLGPPHEVLKASLSDEPCPLSHPNLVCVSEPVPARPSAPPPRHEWHQDAQGPALAGGLSVGLAEPHTSPERLKRGVQGWARLPIRGQEKASGRWDT